MASRRGSSSASPSGSGTNRAGSASSRRHAAAIAIPVAVSDSTVGSPAGGGGSSGAPPPPASAGVAVVTAVSVSGNPQLAPLAAAGPPAPHVTFSGASAAAGDPTGALAAAAYQHSKAASAFASSQQQQPRVVVGRATNGLFDGVGCSLASKNHDYLCPICFELLQEAHMTRCGHTFCHECIVRSLAQGPRCPKCNFFFEKPSESVFPNFAVDELVSKFRAKQDAVKEHLSQPHLDGLRSALVDNVSLLGMTDVDYLLRFLAQRREEIESESYLTQQLLLKEFLELLKRQKDDHLYQLQKEVDVIEADLDRVRLSVDEFTAEKLSINLEEEDSAVARPPSGKRPKPDGVVPSLDVRQQAGGHQPQQQQGNKALLLTAPFGAVLNQRKQRMHAHFDDLTQCYFNTRAKDMIFPEASAASAATATASSSPSHKRRGDDDVEYPDDDPSSLGAFSHCLSKFTRYSSVRPLATLSYTSDMFSNASIVSSIEFDKDNEFFAIAGVTKRIKIYDYNMVIKDVVDIHYPTTEMTCTSKISCVAWSYFYKNNLVSSDYDGTVTVWDTNAVEKVKTFHEHEKRCWSVDYNLVDTKLIASGSDDARVKLWSTNVNHSVASLEAKANICCVKFNPTSCYHLAFGSADHCVHYYDLRNTKSALCVFRGHKKAVSYVKFLNGSDLVSASTDSQLKLWDVTGADSCRRSFQGHVNEKNFVGLATDGDYVTCGSENNSLYVYYKGLSKPLFHYKFDVVRGFFERSSKAAGAADDDGNEFVSAVCWRRNTNVLVGANSQGTIKVLEMV